MSITLFNQSARARDWLYSIPPERINESATTDLVEAFAYAFQPEGQTQADLERHYARCWAIARAIILGVQSPHEAAKAQPDGD